MNLTTPTSLTSNDYQRATRSTAIYPGAGTGSIAALSYLALGLGNEAGEVQGVIKKVLRDKDGRIDIASHDALVKELGDTQWYLARLADELGTFLADVQATNLMKLEDRAERGVLQGSGDHR